MHIKGPQTFHQKESIPVISLPSSPYYLFKNTMNFLNTLIFTLLCLAAAVVNGK